MVAINGYYEKLQRELAQQERRKPIFAVQDFERISEIDIGSMSGLCGISLDQPSQTFTENLLEDLFHDKLQFTHETIFQINEEIRIRKNILFETHEEIDKDVKALTAELHHLELCGLERGVGILRANTRTQITQLQKEQRQSLALTWQDVTRLRKDLRAYIEKYDSLLRTRFLLHMGGD